MSVHPTALAGFRRAAREYERGRPGYPEEAVDWLARRLGLRPGAVVVDLAAGTGKLSRELLRTGARVIAVEPVRAMREMLRDAVPEAEALDGTAEAIPLPDRSADALTVAQAFHWFDAGAAAAEIHRVLRPGGALAVLWNRPDARQELQAGIAEVLAELAATPYRGAESDWRGGIERSALFTALRARRFRNVQRLDRDGLVDRVTSISFVSALPARERGRVAERALRLVDGRPEPIELAYVTEIYLCRRRKRERA